MKNDLLIAVLPSPFAKSFMPPYSSGLSPFFILAALSAALVSGIGLSFDAD